MISPEQLPQGPPPGLPMGPGGPPGGLPPEALMALLGGGPDAGGPPPEGADEGTGMSPAEHLRAAIAHAQAALVGEQSDPDSQKLADVVKGLYSILADRQKQQQKMLAGTAGANYGG
jgi:hypothetical protein